MSWVARVPALVSGLKLTAHLAVAASLVTCAATQAPGCGPGEDALVEDVLYFGTDRRQAPPVSDAEWADFLASEVTPRFPSGLTHWAAQGQWRGSDGVIVREASHVLQLLHPGEEADHGRVREMIAVYKQRYAQESVLRVSKRSCAAF